MIILYFLLIFGSNLETINQNRASNPIFFNIYKNIICGSFFIALTIMSYNSLNSYEKTQALTNFGNVTSLQNFEQYDFSLIQQGTFNAFIIMAPIIKLIIYISNFIYSEFFSTCFNYENRKSSLALKQSYSESTKLHELLSSDFPRNPITNFLNHITNKLKFSIIFANAEIISSCSFPYNCTPGETNIGNCQTINETSGCIQDFPPQCGPTMQEGREWHTIPHKTLWAPCWGGAPGCIPCGPRPVPTAAQINEFSLSLNALVSFGVKQIPWQFGIEASFKLSNELHWPGVSAATQGTYFGNESLSLPNAYLQGWTGNETGWQIIAANITSGTPKLIEGECYTTPCATGSPISNDYPSCLPSKNLRGSSHSHHMLFFGCLVFTPFTRNNPTQLNPCLYFGDSSNPSPIEINGDEHVTNIRTTAACDPRTEHPCIPCYPAFSIHLSEFSAYLIFKATGIFPWPPLGREPYPKNMTSKNNF